uniref:Trichohyalin n=1 Tax=Rhizophora mucronata TaxID=61149 RepID=A0A2P2KJU0_RHIMU
MGEEGSSTSDSIVTEERKEKFYPMYFGVSCALIGLRVLSIFDKEDDQWPELCKKMLHGSAQLLGLLVWKMQREGSNSNGGPCELLRNLETARKEIEHLKKMRHEDARANEKVVGIFASQEQGWLTERKKLHQDIGILLNELRVLERKEEAVSEMNDKLEQMEHLVQSKDLALEEEENKRKELEARLMKAENVAEELRETAKREAQEHCADLLKHKTAFMELASNQRQLEAEMGRAMRQIEAKRNELNLVSEQKVESVALAEKLSTEVMKMRKELEQKDKILSAMLRKSKLDTAEKQMLLKEVKLSKANRKQSELEAERWRTVSEARHERHSLRSMFTYQSNSGREDPAVAREASQIGRGRALTTDHVLEYYNSHVSDCYSLGRNDKPDDVKQLEEWVHLEAEKYATAMERRHHLEIDAFAEQMSLKDERLEACRWRLLGVEIESKRLQSHVERLNQEILDLRHQNVKLGALLLGREQELNALKEQFAIKIKQKILPKANFSSSLPEQALPHDTIWSTVKVIKRKPMEGIQETKASIPETSEEKDAISSTVKIVKRKPTEGIQETKAGITETSEAKDLEEDAHTCFQSQNTRLIVRSQEKEAEEKEDADRVPVEEESTTPLESDCAKQLPSPSQPVVKTNNSSWRIDLHALGVSYRIKTLKQQLLMLERLTGKKESWEDVDNNGIANTQHGMNNFLLLMSLLNKQVSRYQSLQGNTDELCKRMVGSNFIWP